MNHQAGRRSRRGIAQVWLIAGGVAAAGLLGFMLYKAYKKKQEQNAYGQSVPYSYQTQAYSGQQPMMYNPPVPPKGYAAAPTAPQSSGGGYDERAGDTQDPELTRLFQAVKNAHEELTAAMVARDGDRITEARGVLANAQAALNARKATMF